MVHLEADCKSKPRHKIENPVMGITVIILTIFILMKLREMQRKPQPNGASKLKEENSNSLAMILPALKVF
ncbi:hypothetical protein KIN20_024776 [Parelaphostrongylus tenuis]|uniref:Uncharacterized protein n=1 Tax=Parelaphostrongylus tenuis TaxID=148309 RepID=A0AAD5QXN6_PARTN|nr:hypothetical protein KIN20_024776 [Parelaphostrongylus tenuis]